MPLIRIMYLSEAANFTSSQALDNISAQAAQTNARMGITGVLLKIGNGFFQILEGDEVVVSNIFAKISKDTRHIHVRLIDKELDVHRAFGQWSMGCINLDDEYILDLKLYRELRERIQAIVKEQRSSKQALIEIMQTLPKLLELKAKKPGVC